MRVKPEPSTSSIIELPPSPRKEEVESRPALDTTALMAPGGGLVGAVDTFQPQGPSIFSKHLSHVDDTAGRRDAQINPEDIVRQVKAWSIASPT